MPRLPLELERAVEVSEVGNDSSALELHWSWWSGVTALTGGRRVKETRDIQGGRLLIP